MEVLLKALVKEGLITEKQLQMAKVKQMGSKNALEDSLIQMGLIVEEDLTKLSLRLFEVPFSNLNEEAIERSATKIIPAETAKRYGVFPMRRKGNVLVLAMSNPEDVVALNDMRLLTKMDIDPVCSTKNAVSRAIEKYYQDGAPEPEEVEQPAEPHYEFLKNLVEDTTVELIKEEREATDHFDIKALQGKQSPAVRLVNLILSDAVKMRASDIHIEPQEGACRVRYRIDGKLRDIVEIPNQLRFPVVARVKVMADLELAERRKTQDGRIKISAYNRKIDLRISILPTYYGEKVVMRLLDTKEAKLKLDRLGFSESDLNLIKKASNRPQGMVLVTGPTGSGKTSTLYATLNFIKSEAKNIITIEDPIEYLIDGINQIQLNPLKDVTFATSLRSILRQDPNVILVGEIRDKETAEIAFRSSLTGHLVFSTLHTNTSVATITRLLDIGLEPYLIASSLILIIAQRLIRVICPHCKEEYSPDVDIRNKFRIYIEKLNIQHFFWGNGCEQCSFTGFLGRTAIFEFLNINEKIRSLISNKSPEDLILKEARRGGLKLLAEAGMEKVAQGITTLEEVASVAEVVGTEQTLESPDQAKGKLKILVADDDADILKGLEIRLKAGGYEVVTAKNGKELVEYAFKEKPALILSDVMMPEMDGFEATKILRSRLETALIPILMLTGRGDAASELEGLDLGADDYVSKPFDADILLARIKRLLRRRYREDEGTYP